MVFLKRSRDVNGHEREIKLKLLVVSWLETSLKLKLNNCFWISQENFRVRKHTDLKGGIRAGLPTQKAEGQMNWRLLWRWWNPLRTAEFIPVWITAVLSMMYTSRDKVVFFKMQISSSCSSPENPSMAFPFHVGWRPRSLHSRSLLILCPHQTACCPSLLCSCYKGLRSCLSVCSPEELLLLLKNSS